MKTPDFSLKAEDWRKRMLNNRDEDDIYTIARNLLLKGDYREAIALYRTISASNELECFIADDVSLAYSKLGDQISAASWKLYHINSCTSCRQRRFGLNS